MQIKTITGSSIQAALSEARTTLGDHVVLLESVAAEGDTPARITVMVDAPRMAVRQTIRQAVPAGSDDAPEALAPLGHGYAPRTAKRPLFTPPAAPAPPTGPSPEVMDKLEALADRLAVLDRMAERVGALDGLADRMDRMERRLGDALVGDAHVWAGHPVYGAFLRQGLKTATTTDLLHAAAERGVDPSRTDAEACQSAVWAAAQTLRDRLDPTTPSRYTADTLVAVGPGGSGKTTMLLRLATDPRFYGRREVGILIVVPEDAPPSYDPTEPYRQQGLSARTVRSAEEVRQALDYLHGTAALLIDTPALPTAPDGAVAALDRLATILAPLTAFEVVLTLDAARAHPPLDLAKLDRLPLPPTMAALTRLDEAPDWGRVADWLLALHRPVGFATMGADLAHTLTPYSPSWFVEAFATRLDVPSLALS